MRARYYTRHKSSVSCTLCPRQCNIGEGAIGLCRVRYNRGGELIAGGYGRLSAIHTDPVEKKPLYHWNPGGRIVSIGSYGCNLGCNFCQNHHISQRSYPTVQGEGGLFTAGEVTEMVPGSQGGSPPLLAFTYNEPTVWIEFMLDCAALAASHGAGTAMVTNGYINADPLADLLELIDAFNVDIKSYSDEFYRRYTGGRLQPVLDTARTIAGSGKHLELTMLVIPGLNDDLPRFREMLQWIRGECGERSILHISRYYPAYKSEYPPTPEDTIARMAAIAREQLQFVYTGNLQSTGNNNTLCPGCGKLLIERNGYSVKIVGSGSDGSCSSCGEQVFSLTSSC